MTSLEEMLFSYQLEKKITQQEISARLNISQATYNNWINHKTPIAFKYYPVIAKVCSIDIGPFLPHKDFNVMQVTDSSEDTSQGSISKEYQSFAQKVNNQIDHLLDNMTKLQDEVESLRKRLPDVVLE